MGHRERTVLRHIYRAFDRYRFNSAWRGGAGEEIEVFSDYKAFGGWLMPTREAHKSADGLPVQATSTLAKKSAN
jgi:hypothetical protein